MKKNSTKNANGQVEGSSDNFTKNSRQFADLSSLTVSKRKKYFFRVFFSAERSYGHEECNFDNSAFKCSQNGQKNAQCPKKLK